LRGIEGELKGKGRGVNWERENWKGRGVKGNCEESGVNWEGD